MPTQGTGNQPIRILVTGEHEDFQSRCPSALPSGEPLEWVQIPVLEFQRLPVPEGIVERLIHKPVDWIIFTSSRAVSFWSEVLMEQGLDFPLETQVACIGEHTAEIASRDGFTTDFFPTEPGTEKFLEEFEDLLSNNSVKPSIFIPMAEGGRTTLRDRLKSQGCEVISISLYRSLPRTDIAKTLSKEELEKASLILFTSPSSCDALLKAHQIPSHVKVASLGRYTASHLLNKGFIDQKMLPDGDFHRIAEVLC